MLKRWDRTRHSRAKPCCPCLGSFPAVSNRNSACRAFSLGLGEDSCRKGHGPGCRRGSLSLPPCRQRGRRVPFLCARWSHAFPRWEHLHALLLNQRSCSLVWVTRLGNRCLRNQSGARRQRGPLRVSSRQCRTADGTR